MSDSVETQPKSSDRLWVGDGKFTPGVCNVYFTATDLYVRTAATADGKLSQWINGKATIDRDELAVIGTNVPHPTELSVQVIPIDDEALRPSPSNKRWPEDTAPEVLAYLERCAEEFKAKPATAEVFYSRHGPRPGLWYVVSWVQGEVFHALRDDILAERCGEVRLDIELRPKWTDEPWGEGEYGSTVGLLPSKYGDAAGYGWTEGISWPSLPPSADLRHRVSEDDGGTEAGPPQPAPSAPETAITALAATVRRGFIGLGLLTALMLLKWLLG